MTIFDKVEKFLKMKYKADGYVPVWMKCSEDLKKDWRYHVYDWMEETALTRLHKELPAYMTEEEITEFTGCPKV